ncbi:hypothetical protein IFM89_038014 [Coptis chinensis]|uniref:Amino acid permease/ SLC12A domain-containing protein n=1 Tax=Coptis chinensis TaxID=261450 RepID=A0A835HS16_9MAGN|nr:hypothetical protein IFM89_038014 [Coptis chinensis]
MHALEIHSQNPGIEEQGSKNMDTYLDESKLEANQPDSGAKSKKLTMLPLMFLIYFAVSGGPFGEESTVKAAEMGSLKFLSGVINNAAYPVLCADYMKHLFPILKSASTGLTLGEKGRKTDWTLYFNTLFWNLNFWDNASTLAGEVDKPQSTFPKALFSAGIITCLGYLIPLLAATGSFSVNQSLWDDGYLAEAGNLIAGNWLKIWIEVGLVLSSIGLFEAQLSCSSYQLLDMADLGTLPRFFGWRARYFNTPWVGILVCTIFTIGVSYLNFTDIVSSANFLYSFGMILEFASFLWLRKKYPTMNRPYKVPLGIPALTIVCLIPTGFIIYVCCIATRMVYLISGSLILLGVVLYWLMTVIKSKADKNSGGSYKGPVLLRKSLTTESDGQDRYERFESHNETRSSSSENLKNVSGGGGGGTWGQDLRVNVMEVSNGGSSSSHAAASKSREERLLETVVTSGGVRLQPSCDALQVFIVEASKLNAVALSRAIDLKLQSHLWQQGESTMQWSFGGQLCVDIMVTGKRHKPRATTGRRGLGGTYSSTYFSSLISFSSLEFRDTFYCLWWWIKPVDAY